MPPPVDDMDELYVDEWGDTITLRTMTKSAFSKWGDATESNSDDATVVARVVAISGNEEHFPEGIVQLGDIMVTFKSTETVTISNSNIEYHVLYNSDWYKVISVVLAPESGLKHALCRRI